MKKIYLQGFKSWCLVAVLFMLAQTSFAQTDITWNGSISSAAEEPQNWTPEGAIAGNNLIFGNAGTYTNPCIISGAQTIDVNIFNNGGSGPAEILDEAGEVIGTTPAGVVTIDMDQGATFRINGSANSAGDYMNGVLNVVGGNFHYNRNKNFYVDNNSSEVTLNCDTATFRHWVGLGDSGGSKGGRINVLGHTLVTMGSLDRIPLNLGRVHFFVGDEAEVRVNGDRVAWINERIVTGSVATDADKDLVVKYNTVKLYTSITTRLKNAFVIEPTDRQLLVAGESGTEVMVVQNDGFNAMTGGVEWVYGTVDGVFDQSFSPAQTGTSVTPLFAEPGTFFLALKGIDGTAAVHYTNSVECVVASNKAVLSNYKTQNLRLGQQAYMISVIEETEASSREWKYRTADGEFMSFDPAITGLEFSADFAEAGTYFVVCQSTIDGVVNTTKEVQYNISTWNSGALNITFSGDIVSDPTNAKNMMNWTPAAYIHKNSLIIPEGMTAEIRKGEKDTIAGLNIGLGGLLTYRGESATDTIWYRADHNSSPGSFLVESGVFIKDAYYFRLYDPNTVFTVTGDAKTIISSGILLGGSNNPANGANLSVKDNAVMLFNTWPGRISANAGYSEFRMEGNAKYQFLGDARGTVAPWITGTKDAETGEYTFNPKFITPTGTVPYMVYDPNTDLTTVSIRDLSAFGVEQTKTQVVGKGQATNALTLINSGAYSTFEWKYSSSANGPWESFATPVTGASASVSFATVGTYYVAAVGDGSAVTTNAVPVKVVDIAVTPEAPQYIAVDDDGNLLTVTLPEGATGVQWKYATTSGGPYEEFLPQEQTETYLPWGDEFTGNHYVVYEATVLDDDGQQVTVYSNEVSIIVGATSIGSLDANDLNIYPNPSNGSFTIELANDTQQTVTVYDVVGNVVLVKEVNAGGIVPVSISTKGIYLVKVTSGSNSIVKRVVVQ